MALHQNTAPQTVSSANNDIKNHVTGPNSLPAEQRTGVWATSTLWSVIIFFAIFLLILIIGAVKFFSR